MNHVLQYDRSKLTPTEQSFIDGTVECAAANRFRVHMIQKRYVIYASEKMKVNGYVSEPDRLLAVATARSKKHWLMTFVHEASHMDQCIEQAKPWTDLKVGSGDACEFVFFWLDHVIELSNSQRDDYVDRTMRMELDCEKRATKKVGQYNLDLDINAYIQQANAYIYFYPMLKKTRQWYTIGKEPYVIKQIVSQMPTHFDNDYTKLPLKFENLYRQYCY